MSNLKTLLKEYILRMPKDEALKLLGYVMDNTDDDTQEWEDLESFILEREEDQ